MSCSKPLPPFVFDLLYYLNRNQLERFSIICRPLKNFIDRYLHSKPYRVFDRLSIRGGSYALIHNNAVRWHPNRDNYSTQQFLAGQECNIDVAYYSFAEMRPFLGPTIRIELTTIYVAGDSTYCHDHVEEMESISYLWRDRRIDVLHAGFPVIDTIIGNVIIRITAEDFLNILNSPTILQCQHLFVHNARISFKDYKVLYAMKVIEICYQNEEDIDVWPQFLEQPGVKPVVILHYSSREYIEQLLDRLSKIFSSTISPNSFKILIVGCYAPLTEFRQRNSTSSETLELDKGLPIEYQHIDLPRYNSYTLKRSSV